MPLPTQGKPHLNRQEEMSWSSFRRRRVPWCGRPDLNRRSSSSWYFVCVGLLARALELELSRKGAAILCVQ